MAKQMQKSKSPVNPTSEEIVEEEVSTPVETVEKKVATPVEPMVNSSILQTVRSNYILCRSVTAGGLHISCKSGNSYYFRDYGSESEIEYYDLIALIRKRSDHIFAPRIIIEDENILAEFPQISQAYAEAYSREDLIEVLNLPLIQMQGAIKSLPESTTETMRSLIASEIANGHIDSVKKIRFLSEYYKSDFNLISELFSK